MNEIEKKLKEKVIDEKLYYVTKGGQKVHCFDLISYDDALEICKQVSVEPEVKVQIAEEKQNTHNMDIIHLGCCTKCGGINFTNQNCKWWDSNLSA